jgi:spore maturation protein CgeB
VVWPSNVERIEHLPPGEHRRFYNRQRFTLNITRADMVLAGWSPSVRLFEAAACGTPIISDWWEGLDTLFAPGEEIVIASSGADILSALQGMSEGDRNRLGRRARERVLEGHTAAQRSRELEKYVEERLAVRPAGFASGT